MKAQTDFSWINFITRKPIAGELVGGWQAKGMQVVMR
jgi:hypothetical protein